jgi:hypothetical protein
MIVASDTSAATPLIQVGRIDLLARIYEQVFVPAAVQVELLRTHPTLPEYMRSRLALNPAEVRRPELSSPRLAFISGSPFGVGGGVSTGLGRCLFTGPPGVG